MSRFLIKSVNGALLMVILIGIPAATRARFGSWEISSAPTAENLIFWGLTLALIANVLGAAIFVPEPKAKALCVEWALIFGGFLFLEYAYVRGWINFDWLRNFLLWLQKHF